MGIRRCLDWCSFLTFPIKAVTGVFSSLSGFIVLYAHGLPLLDWRTAYVNTIIRIWGSPEWWLTGDKASISRVSKKKCSCCFYLETQSSHWRRSKLYGRTSHFTLNVNRLLLSVRLHYPSLRNFIRNDGFTVLSCPCISPLINFESVTNMQLDVTSILRS